jgi:hypothetical protein
MAKNVIMSTWPTGQEKSGFGADGVDGVDEPVIVEFDPPQPKVRRKARRRLGTSKTTVNRITTTACERNQGGLIPANTDTVERLRKRTNPNSVMASEGRAVGGMQTAES